MSITEMSSRQLEIELLQRAIAKRAVAIHAFEVGIKVLKEKQTRGFAELAKQMSAEQDATARHPNVKLTDAGPDAPGLA